MKSEKSYSCKTHKHYDVILNIYLETITLFPDVFQTEIRARIKQFAQYQKTHKYIYVFFKN